MRRTVTDNPILNAVYTYWRRKRGNRDMPDRRDIDPAELPPRVLPHIMLLELVDGPHIARYRLIGTEIVERVGSDQTGMFLDGTISGDYLEYARDLLGEIRNRRAAFYTENVFRWNVGQRAVTRRVFLPLTNGGADPAIVFVGAIFEYSAPLPPYRMLLDDARHEETHRRVLADAAGGGRNRER